MTAPQIKLRKKKEKKEAPKRMMLRKARDASAPEKRRGYARQAICMNLRAALGAQKGRGDVSAIFKARDIAREFGIEGIESTFNKMHIKVLMNQGKYEDAAKLAREKGEIFLMKNAARKEIAKRTRYTRDPKEWESGQLVQFLGFAHFYGLEEEIRQFGTLALKKYIGGEADKGRTLLALVVPCSLDRVAPEECMGFLKIMVAYEPLKVAEIAKAAGLNELMTEAGIAHITSLLGDPSRYSALRRAGIPEGCLKTMTPEGAAEAFGISEEQLREINENAFPEDF